MTMTVPDHRTDAEVLADVADRQMLATLAEAAGSHEYQASISANGGSQPNEFRHLKRARACRRAIKRINFFIEEAKP